MMTMERRRNVVKTTECVNGVTFVNYPAYVDADDETLVYGLLEGVVAERVANQFPEHTRKAVTVDFDKLDLPLLSDEVRREWQIQSPFATEDEAKQAEQKLLTVLFG
jgi:hypothetical protein